MKFVCRAAKFAATVVIAPFFVCGLSIAQTWPAKPVRVVIPWPPGGSNDVVGRIVMQKVGESLGQQFVVDNRPGASGAIGAEPVAKAPPDGYTIMVHSTTHVGNAHRAGESQARTDQLFVIGQWQLAAFVYGIVDVDDGHRPRSRALQRWRATSHGAGGWRITGLAGDDFHRACTREIGAFARTGRVVGQA